MELADETAKPHHRLADCTFPGFVVSADPALEAIEVGVIVARSKAQSPWIDFTWKPISVLVGSPEAVPWTLLSEDRDQATFYAGSAELRFHRTETGNYRDNLASGEPKLWVALRPTGADPPYQVFAVTADPAEGEALSETGSDLVDVVAMPESLRAQIERFVARHHVERPFRKRRRDRADPEALARQSPMRKERR
jgi:hypothetical protein